MPTTKAGSHILICYVNPLERFCARESHKPANINDVRAILLQDDLDGDAERFGLWGHLQEDVPLIHVAVAGEC